MPKILPSTAFPPFRRYYDLSDFLFPFLTSSLLHLSISTLFLREKNRISHVHWIAFITCRALLTPEMLHISAFIDICSIAFSSHHTICHLKIGFNGALSLQPFGLRPTISLSTLNISCYQRYIQDSIHNALGPHFYDCTFNN